MTTRPADITIVGLGPGPAELRTVAAQRALDTARHIYIRNHPGSDFADVLARPNVTDVATLRDPSAPPGRRWRAATQAVLDGAAHGPVVLAIPGHARFGEMLTIETIREAEALGLRVELLDGVSMIDLLCSALELDPVLERVQLMDGRSTSRLQQDAPFDGGKLTATPRLPMLITHVYDNAIMRPLARQLSRILPPDHPLTLISEAGLPTESRDQITLADLAEHQGGPLLAIFVPPLPVLDAGRDARTLQHIVARLRQPDGCPWDRKQTNATLKGALVDEVYEAVDAIDAGDMENLAEELGDLFLLIAMHAQIAEEAGHFTLEDVYEGIATKIVRRHPHVFGDDAAEHAEEVVGLWQKIKAEERANGKTSTKAADGQPRSMPGLERAARVLKKHPLDVTGTESDDPGDRLMGAIAGIIDAGDDPDTVLRAALERHVKNAPDRDGS